MKIGLVGYQGSGKSTLFHWLTGAQPDLAQAHRSQAAMCVVPEPRVEALCEIYKPKKVTLASLEIVDTPGLSRTHEGSATKLAMIRDTACLVMVIAAFDGSVPAEDLNSFEEDLLIADLDIVSGRIERLREQVKKPRPNRDELEAELEAAAATARSTRARPGFAPARVDPGAATRDQVVSAVQPEAAAGDH